MRAEFNISQFCRAIETYARAIGGRWNIHIARGIGGGGWGELMWIARVVRPGALDGASVSAQTPETIGGAIVTPNDIEEITDANSAMAIDISNYAHMPGFEAFGRKFERMRTARIY